MSKRVRKPPASDGVARVTASEDTVAEKMVSKDTSSQAAASLVTGPEDTVSSVTVPQEAAPQEAVPDDAVPDVAASEAVTPEAAAPESAASEAVPPELAPEPPPATVAPQQDAPRRPERWLVIQASAALAAVAVTNYVCYGGAKVPRYGEAETPQPPRDPSILCAEIIARGPAGESQVGTLRLAELDLRFRQMEQSEQQVIWAWTDPPRWLQVYWVWDFFRLQSHIALRVGLPVPGTEAESAWAGTVAAIRAIASGDSISVRVQSPCGNIFQAHPVTAAAVEWSPPTAPGQRRGLAR